ncbi:unnamed protein product [Cladocopium goreaui]|uniref:magnesium chelatase n=1 Tax=Cladocopium goreaui TaxID=2562237 RepID=A0A9P1DFH4_9DINO|nr:unnamed protein product [Cladocopium goreaui]
MQQTSALNRSALIMLHLLLSQCRYGCALRVPIVCTMVPRPKQDGFMVYAQGPEDSMQYLAEYLHGALGHAAIPSLALAVALSRSRRHNRRADKRIQCCAVAEKEKTTTERPVYPFSAIVGQSEMKLSLILNVIDPKIGGVMIMGDRGTGKTTTIRALVDLLPEIACVSDDPYNSSPEEEEVMSQEVRDRKASGEDLPLKYKKVPMIDLPLGATEDRVCGTIDIEKALTQGKKAFEPGLLAKANRGILYVDEVNLLDDHLVDVLLDSAAGGWNTVEREGISIRHPAKFILVGSGNPEEGELRPQLLDRFGMHALIRTERDPELRVKIVESTRDFADDPVGFREKFLEDNQEFATQILEVKSSLNVFVVVDG